MPDPDTSEQEATYLRMARTAVDAFNNRDTSLMAELTDPEFEYRPGITAIEGGSYRGQEEVDEYFQSIPAEWERFELTIEELRARGDTVLGLGELHAHGRGSGVQLDQPVGFVATFRRGKLLTWTAYTDQQEAVRAAGLE